KAEHFCDSSIRLARPQVRFSEMALQQNFAVFALDSSVAVTDNEGALCGKVWDDEVRARANLDLPYLHHVLTSLIPNLRKEGDSNAVFITGLSSGGYMTARAASS